MPESLNSLPVHLLADNYCKYGIPNPVCTLGRWSGLSAGWLLM